MTQAEGTKQRIANATKLLYDIELKPQTRPNANLTGRTEKEVRWALRLYTCGSIALFRWLLAALVREIDSPDHVVGAFIARALLENSVHALFVGDKVQELTKDPASAWRFLERVNQGSKYMREFSSLKDELRQRPDPLEDPVRIGKAFEHADRLMFSQDKKFYRMWTYFSELTHPAALALNAFTDVNTGLHRVEFSTSPHDSTQTLLHAGVATTQLYLYSVRRLGVQCAMKTLTRSVEQVFAEFNRGE